MIYILNILTLFLIKFLIITTCQIVKISDIPLTGGRGSLALGGFGTDSSSNLMCQLFNLSSGIETGGVSEDRNT